MGESICTVEGCERPCKSRGRCARHYNQLRRQGGIDDRSTWRQCVIDACRMFQVGRGLCSTHYARWRRWGDPAASRPFHVPLPDRFWAKVDRRGPDECWEWQGGRTMGGYGRFEMPGQRGRGTGAHRVAYQLLVGPIPDGLTLDHLCRNKPCVNPAHLEPVTAEENLRRQGRTRTVCRNGHPRTPENIVVWQGVRRCRPCRMANRDKFAAIASVLAVVGVFR